MKKSNGRAMTWAKHNAMLGGHLQEVLNAIQKLPGLVERNERRLQWLAEQQPSVMDILAKPPPKTDAVVADDQLSTSVGSP